MERKKKPQPKCADTPGSEKNGIINLHPCQTKKKKMQSEKRKKSRIRSKKKIFRTLEEEEEQLSRCIGMMIKWCVGWGSKLSWSSQSWWQAHHHPVPFFSYTIRLLALPLPLKCFCKHFIRNTDPETVTGLSCHCATSSSALLRLFADYSAEVFPAHERQRYARYLTVSDCRGRLEGLLEVLFGLNRRLRMYGCAEQVVSRLNVLVGTWAAKWFKGR